MNIHSRAYRTFDAFDLDTEERLEAEIADGTVTTIQVPGDVVWRELVFTGLHVSIQGVTLETRDCHAP